MTDTSLLKKVSLAHIHGTTTHLGYCGHRQLKLLASTFVDGRHADIPLKQWSRGWYDRHTGQMLPFTFLKQAAKYGLRCYSGTFGGSVHDAIHSIKTHLKQIERPIVVVIGHGSEYYAPLEDKLRKNILLQHRVSIWGYDDTYLYIYDSTLPEHNGLPTGNLALTYEQFIHYRNWGYVGMRRHNAILIY